MASDVIEALPVRGRWDFGGYPYGLEPLTLPLTASGQAVDGTGSAAMTGTDVESSRESLLALLMPDGVSDSAAGRLVPDPVERIFWFRWITGHQTTFILWQLLARAMAAPDGNDSSSAVAESCRVFVRGYSAMLLYTGSCPRGIYQQVIRRSMALQHPGFSGAWARDFWPVRGLLSSRAADRAPDTPLGRECRVNAAIHQGIADKLVPDGTSLLQAAVGQDTLWRRSALAVLYDTFFLTLRAPIPYRALAHQTIRRLHAIGRDIAVNGLYPPYASSAAENPPSLRTPEVAECERAIPETLYAIAAEVAKTDWHLWEVP